MKIEVIPLKPDESVLEMQAFFERLMRLAMEGIGMPPEFFDDNPDEQSFAE